VMIDTLVVGAVVGSVSFLLARSLIRTFRTGGTGCACKGCPLSGSCSAGGPTAWEGRSKLHGPPSPPPRGGSNDGVTSGWSEAVASVRSYTAIGRRSAGNDSP